MKSIKVIVIGFILAIALVVWPVEYTRNITAGTGFLLGGVLAACSGFAAGKAHGRNTRMMCGGTQAPR